MLAIVVENLYFHSFIQIAYFLLLTLMSNLNMIKKSISLFAFFLSTFLLLAQSNNADLLIKAKQLGLVKYIGASLYNEQECDYAVESRIYDVFMDTQPYNTFSS